MGIIAPQSTSTLFGLTIELGTTPAGFQAGTYTTANVLEASGEYTVISGTSVQSWDYLDKDGGADGGFTLNITSTGAEVVVDGGAAWPTPHGTATFTLSPKGGTATGTVTATATF
jgi:hypothetical protein